jgi:IclR family KDG regulon transcriptional repressor
MYKAWNKTMDHDMKLPSRETRTYRVQSLERALDVLDCFSFQDRELTLSDIAHKTGMNKATTKRLVFNFTSRGYLHQDPATKRYRLGMRLFELGGIVFSSFSLRKASSYPMSSLQNLTGATVLLGVKMDDQLVYVDKREGQGVIRISSDIGWRRPLHYGMLGMVLMSFMEPKEIKTILKKAPLQPYTPRAITDEDAFSLRLEMIRKQGYILEKGEAVEGLIGIAAPIRDYSRQVIAALGVALTSNSPMAKEDLDKMITLVVKACDDISGELGYLKV